jgi:hypothetical protein
LVSSKSATTFTLDGGSLRVKKVNGSTTTVYIFSGSTVIAEYANGSLGKEYIYSGGQLLATHEGATLKYQMGDHLSTRITTDTSGTVVAQSGHYPYGGLSSAYLILILLSRAGVAAQPGCRRSSRGRKV